MGIAFVRGSQSIGAMESRKAAKATPARIAALRKASEANPTYRRVELNGTIDTVTGHCRREGVSVSTVRKRLARGMSVEAAFKKRSYVTVPTTKAHRWRHDVLSRPNLLPR